MCGHTIPCKHTINFVKLPLMLALAGGSQPRAFFFSNGVA